jgi:hypothetical protein
MRIENSFGSVQWLGKNDLPFKSRWAERVYAKLENAYEDIGGINLGSGFKDPADMLRSIAVWRLVFEKGHLVSVMMFKSKGARLKMVAYTADSGASNRLKKSDFECMVRVSHAELSGALLIAVLRQLGSAAGKYLLAPEKVMLDREIVLFNKFEPASLTEPGSVRTLEKLKHEFPGVLPYLYVRKIGGVTKLKLLIGTLCNPRPGDLLAVESVCGSPFLESPDVALRVISVRPSREATWMSASAPLQCTTLSAQ